MKNKILLFALAIATHSYAQFSNSPTPIKSYYYDYKLANPAFTGILGKHTITTVYSWIPGASSGAPRFTYGSYEVALPSDNAIGAILMADEVGISSQLHFGGFYGRNFRFNERSGLRVGTQVYYQRRTVDYRELEWSDPGDPAFNQVSRTHKGSFDLGTAYYSRYATIAVSLKNILHHDETVFGSLIVLREFDLNKNLKITPSIIYSSDDGHDTWSLNSTFEIAEWVLVGGGCRFSEPGDLTLNAGMNIKDWAQVVVHVYSSLEQKYEGAFFDNRLMELLVRVTVPERKEQ